MNREEIKEIGKELLFMPRDELIKLLISQQQENQKLKQENNRLKHLPKKMEQYILSEMYVNREVVAGWLQFDKLLKMIDRGNE